MKNKEIVVTVEGEPGSGKTTIALMIAQMCRDNLLQGKIEDPDIEDDNDALQAIRMMHVRLASITKVGTRITVKVKQSARRLNDLLRKIQKEDEENAR